LAFMTANSERRLIKALKSTGRRRFAKRTVASLLIVRLVSLMAWHAVLRAICAHPLLMLR
jgi:hypothetical protein